MNERKFLVEQRTCFMNRRQLCTTKEDTQLYDGYIKKLSRDIENIELEEQKLLATDESLLTTYRNLLTIPGIGSVNAINVIVITRNFTAFETARQYASYVGVAPHFRTSGTITACWRSLCLQHAMMVPEVRKAPVWDGVHDLQHAVMVRRKRICPWRP